MLLKLIDGGFPCWFDGGLNAVDVRDVARGHLLAARRGQQGQRYILGGQNIDYRSLMQKVCSLVGSPVPKIRASRNMALAMGAMSEALATYVTHRPPLMATGAVSYTVGRYLYYDIGKAQRDLGYTFRSLNESLVDAVSWFQSSSFRSSASR